MATLRTCLQCRHFQRISYVHPDSILCQENNVPSGYYVHCGKDYYHASDVKISSAQGKKTLACDSFQEFKKFVKKNSNCKVACPRKIACYTQTEQMALNF